MAGLSDVVLRKLRPRGKLYRIADAGGLCIEVHPTSKPGTGHWRYRYRFAGKARMLSLGSYPAQSLKAARSARDDALAQLRTGVDPSGHRRQAKLARATAAENSFEAVGREWLAKQEPALAPATFAKSKWMLEKLAFPWIGAQPVSAVTPPELLACLRRVEARGKLETASRLRERCGQVFRYAIATGRALRDPAADLRGALAAPQVKNRASIKDPAEIGALLRAIEAYHGGLVTACALKLAPLVFVRPGELRHAEWSEFDLDAGEWRIPAAKMKMRSPHIVPLSTQAVAVLRELQPLTGKGRYVFPGVRSSKRPMSENTVLVALRSMGYTKEQMTGHGFRSMASTRLHEMGWKSEVIERQLAHKERNKVKAAYNYAEYLVDRRRMMQGWADYLDALREGRKVVAGAFGKAA